MERFTPCLRDVSPVFSFRCKVRSSFWPCVRCAGENWQDRNEERNKLIIVILFFMQLIWKFLFSPCSPDIQAKKPMDMNFNAKDAWDAKDHHLPRVLRLADALDVVPDKSEKWSCKNYSWAMWAAYCTAWAGSPGIYCLRDQLLFATDIDLELILPQVLANCKVMHNHLPSVLPEGHVRVHDDVVDEGLNRGFHWYRPIIARPGLPFSPNPDAGKASDLCLRYCCVEQNSFSQNSQNPQSFSSCRVISGESSVHVRTAIVVTGVSLDWSTRYSSWGYTKRDTVRSRYA